MRGRLAAFEALAVGVIAVFASLFLFQTYHYGHRAALFPRAISVAILFLIGVFVVSRLRAAVVKPQPDTGTPHSWLLAFGVVTGFVVSIYLVGFAVSTFVYVATHLYLAGYRRHGVIFSFALAMAVGIAAAGYVFAIPLPSGVLMPMTLGER